MQKIIFSPNTYIQGKNEIENLGKYINRDNAYVVIDEFIYNNYKNTIEKSLKDYNINYEISIFNKECSIEEVEKNKKNIKENTIVVGIGGGKSLDLAKAIAYYVNTDVIIVPTIASTDAPCSRLSAIYTENGEFLHYITLKNSPILVLVDTSIIIKAPVRFLIAGMGDALSTYYEVEACYKANKKATTGGYVTKSILCLSKLCKDTILEKGYKAICDLKENKITENVEDIIEANIYLSGLGFENGGLSIAHAIHNGLTILKDSNKTLHGEKVAFATILQLIIENKNMEHIKEIISFCKKVGLPTSLKDLGLIDICDNEIMEVCKVSFDEKYSIRNVNFNITIDNVFNAFKKLENIK